MSSIKIYLSKPESLAVVVSIEQNLKNFTPIYCLLKLPVKKEGLNLSFDWIHVLAANASKKILIIDPTFDRHSRNDQKELSKLFSYLNENSPYFRLEQPEDWNRFRQDQQLKAGSSFLDLINNK